MAKKQGKKEWVNWLIGAAIITAFVGVVVALGFIATWPDKDYANARYNRMMVDDYNRTIEQDGCTECERLKPCHGISNKCADENMAIIERDTSLRQAAESRSRQELPATPEAAQLAVDKATDNYNSSLLRLCPECETIKHCNLNSSDNGTKCLFENLGIMKRNHDRIFPGR